MVFFDSFFSKLKKNRAAKITLRSHIIDEDPYAADSKGRAASKKSLGRRGNTSLNLGAFLKDCEQILGCTSVYKPKGGDTWCPLGVDQSERVMPIVITIEKKEQIVPILQAANDHKIPSHSFGVAFAKKD